jgi:hypothetical protein
MYAPREQSLAITYYGVEIESFEAAINTCLRGLISDSFAVLVSRNAYGTKLMRNWHKAGPFVPNITQLGILTYAVMSENALENSVRTGPKNCAIERTCRYVVQDTDRSFYAVLNGTRVASATEYYEAKYADTQIESDAHMTRMLATADLRRVLSQIEHDAQLAQAIADRDQRTFDEDRQLALALAAGEQL